ncbi:YjdJ family protein [Peribacillus frigoritolerans]|uniref:YjdJ family protein n=1 Tax=Peribacillus frigoritolerans TaxID=450367 RepID=UPI0033066CD5
MFRFSFLFQFGIASILLLISTVCALYEGSAIVDHPSEWKYSTPFSQFLYGEVNSNSYISQLDYFIYAAKFQPTFPAIMVISSLYLLIRIGYHLLKQQHKRFAYYLSFWGGVLFLLSYFIFNSPTFGGQIFFYIWLVSGVLCIVIAVITYFQILNRNTNEITN